MNEVRYWIRKFRSAFFYGPEVITRYILIAKVALLVIYGIFFARMIPSAALIFSTESSLTYPWSFLTYPISTIHIFEFLFAGYLFWFIGGSIERSFGRTTYIKLLLAITLLPSVSLFVASEIWQALGIDFLGTTDVIMAGLWMPNSALLVCWIYINPPAVMFPNTPFRMDSVKLFWVVVALTLFHFAVLQQAPLLALFPLTSIYYAYQLTQKIRFVPQNFRSSSKR